MIPKNASGGILFAVLAAAAYIWRVNSLRAQHRRLEALVAQRTRTLESLLGAHDVFLRGLAHDLKTPLTGLRWQVQVLLRRASAGQLTPPELSESLQAIAASANEAITAIDELHDVTRLAAGVPVPLHREVVDIVALASQLVTVGPGAWRNNVRVESSHARLLLEADRARLGRVFNNLLDNAIKYSSDGTDVVVQIESEERDGEAWARVRVLDSGMGIPANELPLIFERYRRGSNVGSISGEGLGLTSVRQLIDLHSGHLTVESQEGRGTQVTVWLPMIRDDSVQVPRSMSSR